MSGVRARSGSLDRRLSGWARRVNAAFGRGFGWSVAPYPRTDSLEARVREMIDLFGIETVIDVGAHTGGFGRRLRTVMRFDGRIVSFEPSPESYRELSRVVASDSRWDVHDVAVGAVTTTADLHFVDYASGEFDSLRRLSGYAAEYSPQLGSSGHRSLPVEVRRLDELWTVIGGDPASTLLKVDTQGSDRDVIVGAGDLLDRIPVVLTEVAVQALYDGAPLIEDVLADMRQRGFEVTGAFPVNRYRGGARTIEFDCLFVRS